MEETINDLWYAVLAYSRKLAPAYVKWLLTEGSQPISGKRKKKKTLQTKLFN